MTFFINKVREIIFSKLKKKLYVFYEISLLRRFRHFACFKHEITRNRQKVRWGLKENKIFLKIYPCWTMIR